LNSRTLRSCFAVAVVAVASLAPRLAWADPVSDAKDLFVRAREFRAKGDCAGAVPLFRKAAELYPGGLGSVRNLAECEESLGHFASSRRAWLDLKRALLTTDDRKYDSWQKDADDAAARLAPKLATLTIDVNPVGPGGEAAPGTAVQVTLDGEPLASSLVGTALERDPGRHVVKVTGPRVQEPVERAIDLVAGDAKRLAVRVVVTPEKPIEPEVPAQNLPATVPLAPDDSATRARSTKRTVSWIAIGVGAASLAGMGVAIGVRQSALGQLDSQCPTRSGCPSSVQSTENQGHAASTAVTVLSIVGGVTLGSGIILLATTLGPTKQASLVVTPGLGGASAVVRF
jgi:hypothetical protein